jgi:hypothetical protein
MTYQKTIRNFGKLCIALAKNGTARIEKTAAESRGI